MQAVGPGRTLPPMTAIAFDDIDAINAQASEEYGEWGDELVVTQEMINQFADLTGDPQWIHVESSAARRRVPSVARSPTVS